MAKATIMIVEDESIVAEDIRFSLEANGYEVCGVFASGEDALARVGRLQPDLVMMDIHLQGQLDGTETARRLWDEHGIPVVYLSAYSDDKTLDRAKWTRPQAYLIKPFEERELFVTVEIALSKRPQAPLLELPALPFYPALQLALAEHELLPGADLEFVAGWRARLHPAGANAPAQAFDDRSVDVLDIVIALWLQQADTAASSLSLHADDCLRLRGLKQQKSGSGARAGYDEKSRLEIAQQLEALACIELRHDAAWAPLLCLSPDAAPYHWHISPGQALATAALAEPRRTVLFSQRILAFDPYRQKWEKRLARLLCWRWADKESSDFSVEALITRLRVPIDSKNPIRTKERLELALDTLRRDSLIGRWEQPGTDPGIVGKRGWLGLWMRWPLHIEAPPAQAAGIQPDATPAPKASAARERSFGFIRHIRAERGLSQAEVAAAIGLTQAQLSRIEAGGKVQAATLAKIKAWILDQL